MQTDLFQGRVFLVCETVLDRLSPSLSFSSCSSVGLPGTGGGHVLSCVRERNRTSRENVFTKSGGSEVMEPLRRSVEPWLVVDFDVLRNVSVLNF